MDHDAAFAQSSSRPTSPVLHRENHTNNVKRSRRLRYILHDKNHFCVNSKSIYPSLQPIFPNTFPSKKSKSPTNVPIDTSYPSEPSVSDSPSQGSPEFEIEDSSPTTQTFFTDASTPKSNTRPDSVIIHPPTPPVFSDFTSDDHARRLSIISQTDTVNSNHSRLSLTRGLHRKLQGFFGEENIPVLTPFDGSSKPQSTTSNSSDPRTQSPNFVSHNHTIIARSCSTTSLLQSKSSHNYALSKEVSPWEFQNDPSDVDILDKNSNLISHDNLSSSNQNSFPLKAEDNFSPSPSQSKHPSNDSNSSGRKKSHFLPTSASTQAISTTFSKDRSTPERSGETGFSKFTLFNKMRKKDKLEEISPLTEFRHNDSNASISTLEQPPTQISTSITSSKNKKKLSFYESLPSVSRNTTSSTSKDRQIRKDSRKSTDSKEPRMSAESRQSHETKETGKRDIVSRLPFIGSRKVAETSKESAPTLNPARNSSLYFLDTDLSCIDDIVSSTHDPSRASQGGGSSTAGTEMGGILGSLAALTNNPSSSWNAPDSWAVRKEDENAMLTLKKTEKSSSGSGTSGQMYCVRIFRLDNTFATLSISTNSTVAELISLLCKKSMLPEIIDNYQIVLKKHDLYRQLELKDRPASIQKQILEHMGYRMSDIIDDIGRDDHGHLFRFIFKQAQLTGYSGIEKDIGLNSMHKFSHVDLQGRNLFTIPITLYQRASEIVSLNLSRNLSLDLPMDFIQNCVNLREIKFTFNEARHIPPSICLANRLTMLDLSHNVLREIEKINLSQLQGLVSLRLANNHLKRIPTYFAQFTSLRSLNLSCNNLTEVPDHLAAITSLVDLDLGFNSISCVEKIGSLLKLERLWLNSNKIIGDLPRSFANLVNLREIDLRWNGLDNINSLSTLPTLEFIALGHNRISVFEGRFSTLRTLILNHNPITKFSLQAPVLSLASLDISSAKLSQLPDEVFSKVPNVTKLKLCKNQMVSLSTEIWKLKNLEQLTISQNLLTCLPSEIGQLTQLSHLDVRSNHLTMLPPEIWYARNLKMLNLSSNSLSVFPKLGPPPPNIIESMGMPGNASLYTQIISEGVEVPANQFSRSLTSSSTFPGLGHRKVSTVTGRSTSSLSKSSGEGHNWKDVSMATRLSLSFAGSLTSLYLADNRFSDDIFDELTLLTELRILNLSHNMIHDIPHRSFRRWQHLNELYLSGNDLSTLPSEELDEMCTMIILYLNNNKFQVLPAEIAKLQRLAAIDVGCNILKYNVNNWPYDWNWNWNRQLKFLNLSGNKRLEIKPSVAAPGLGETPRDLTDFSSLTKLRILGLMDVTLTVPSVPDQTLNKRVRTVGSSVQSLPYGLADHLGKTEHLSSLDMVVPRFRGSDDELLIGIFDGMPTSNGGSKMAMFLYDQFKFRLAEELGKMRSLDSVEDAIRRTYLSLNRDILVNSQNIRLAQNVPGRVEPRCPIPFDREDADSGCVATVLYKRDSELYVSNVGDAQAILIQSNGMYKKITQKHDPNDHEERRRIRNAGGYVSRQGRLNDALDVSRAFGFAEHSPVVTVSPHISRFSLRESDELLLIATRELWEHLTLDYIIEIVRSERSDLMRAAHKLRDMVIAFGSTTKCMVMLLGVGEHRRRERARFRTHSMSMGPSGAMDYSFLTRRGKRNRDVMGENKVGRLGQEVEAPTGDVTLVFTDIKNSTVLWETFPVAMRSAIKMHNEVMRRHLRLIGGYEVKTEGDAFMVAFQTVTSALLWCFTVQCQLLEVQWPEEIVNNLNGREIRDAQNHVIFRGLSVRMGVHWGTPVCEVDPVTRRMDYFGPMVNRASRISSVADGGQITVSSDFIAEVQRLLEMILEDDKTSNLSTEDIFGDEDFEMQIRRELRALSSLGFEVRDMGECRLKGLENSEYIYLMYPHSLSSRIQLQCKPREVIPPHTEELMAVMGLEREYKKAKLSLPNASHFWMTRLHRPRKTELTLTSNEVWDLWKVCVRIEEICLNISRRDGKLLRLSEESLASQLRSKPSGITQQLLLSVAETQISRIESCVTMLSLRSLYHTSKVGMFTKTFNINDLVDEITANLTELRKLKMTTKL